MKTFDIFAILFLGFSCLVIGATLVYKPAGLIVAGVLFIAFAIAAPSFIVIKSK